MNFVKITYFYEHLLLHKSYQKTLLQYFQQLLKQQADNPLNYPRVYNTTSIHNTLDKNTNEKGLKELKTIFENYHLVKKTIYVFCRAWNIKHLGSHTNDKKNKNKTTCENRHFKKRFPDEVLSPVVCVM